MEIVRVSLVGGAPLLRGGIEAALGRDSRLACVGHGPDAGAFGSPGQAACDVVVVNTETPRADAAVVLKALVTSPMRSPVRPKVVVLTENESADELLATLQLGVHGYGLRHTLQAEDLCAAVLAVAVWGSWMCPRSTHALRVSTVQQPAAAVSKAGAHTRLSEREREVLQLAARGVPEQEIADTLCLTRNTVKTYIQRSLEKLGVTSRKEAYRRAYELRLVADRRGRADRTEGREPHTTEPVGMVA